MSFVMSHEVLDRHTVGSSTGPGIDRDPLGFNRLTGSSEGRELHDQAHDFLPLNTLAIDLCFPPAERPNCAFLALANCQRSFLIPCSFQGVVSRPRGTERREESTREDIHRSISEARKSQRLPTLTAGSSPSRARRSTVLGCKCNRRAVSWQSSKGSKASTPAR